MAVSSKLERYRSISTIGAGGMATVVLAQDQVLGRQVALKRMTVPGDVSGLSRLRREALIGASLSHPNLVSIYDIVTSEDGDQVIVMEYIDGETLGHALSREGKLPPLEALRVLEQVGAALDAIHQQGIVHRDVKPANILLGADGTVKLADLGIAAVPDRTQITTTGAILGSFRYMAPEQLENEPSTPAVDIYALSAVAFELLSGRKARGEANPLAIAHAISTQPPPDLREAWPQAPPGAAAVLTRGMARDPDRRPASAGELTGRLRAALLPEPTAPIDVPKPRARTVAAVPAAPAAAPKPPFPPSTPASPRSATDPAAASGSARRSPPPPIELNRSRRGPLAAAALLLVAAAVALAVILGSGGSGPTTSSTSNASRHSPSAAGGSRRAASKTGAGTGQTGAAVGKTGAAAGKTGAGAAAGSAGSSPTTSAGSSGTSATTGSSAGGSSAGTSSAGTSTSGSGSPSSSGASSPATPPPPGQGGGSPVSSVESFYTLAAAHRYPEAWALADPTFRSQLGGYQSFQSGQAGDRSITFTSTRVLNQSSTAATIAVSTVSQRTDGTKHCAGTVDLQRTSSSAGWLLHLIHINCT